MTSRHLRRLFSRLVCLALVCGTQVQSQDRQEVHFSAESRLVRVDLQVDSGSGFLTGLTAADFRIFDEQQPQSPVTLTRESDPIDLVLLIDASASMQEVKERLKQMAEQAVDILRPEDRIAVCRFSFGARVVVPFTLDRLAVFSAIAKLTAHPGGGTNIYRAVMETSRYLLKSGSPPGQSRYKRVILIVTDGIGGVAADEKRMLSDLREADATVLTLIVGPDSDQLARAQTPAPRRTQSLPLIVNDTGGTIIYYWEPFTAILSRVLEGSRIRYSLFYRAPDALPGSVRKIEVQLAPQVLERYPKARVRARSSYSVPK